MARVDDDGPPCEVRVPTYRGGASFGDWHEDAFLFFSDVVLIGEFGRDEPRLLGLRENPVLTAQEGGRVLFLETGEVRGVVVDDDGQRRSAKPGVMGRDFGVQFAVQAQVGDDGLRRRWEEARAFPGPQAHPNGAQEGAVGAERRPPPRFAQAELKEGPRFGFV